MPFTRQFQTRGRVIGTGEGYVVIVQETGQDLRHVKIVFDQQDLGRGQIHSLAFSILAICMVQSAITQCLVKHIQHQTQPGANLILSLMARSGPGRLPVSARRGSSAGTV
jgi:hypothetical protein